MYCLFLEIYWSTVKAISKYRECLSDFEEISVITGIISPKWQILARQRDILEIQKPAEVHASTYNFSILSENLNSIS
jgi:hypothetical protein